MLNANGRRKSSGVFGARLGASLVSILLALAIAGPASFFVLVPNPAHVAFDRVSDDISLGEKVLARALPSPPALTYRIIQRIHAARKCHAALTPCRLCDASLQVKKTTSPSAVALPECTALAGT